MTGLRPRYRRLGVMDPDHAPPRRAYCSVIAWQASAVGELRSLTGAASTSVASALQAHLASTVRCRFRYSTVHCNGREALISIPSDTSGGRDRTRSCLLTGAREQMASELLRDTQPDYRDAQMADGVDRVTPTEAASPSMRYLSLPRLPEELRGSVSPSATGLDMTHPSALGRPTVLDGGQAGAFASQSWCAASQWAARDFFGRPLPTSARIHQFATPEPLIGRDSPFCPASTACISWAPSPAGDPSFAILFGTLSVPPPMATAPPGPAERLIL
ncbi:uncharacterized protein PSFLO_07635 [Pseudozyma flocculosa]|uniref:Uncharacterized protein n=1 Tax=Pseudozyma flocculosa TaxID=84751 RepID=A0A5C3FCL6_9BASI|nr:uncharacterized protein PSFLO_07635 [Pseudozyma flocculosa]